MSNPPNTHAARSLTGAKRSARVEARVSDELKLDLARRCHELGMTESDFIERLLAASLYGVVHVLTMEQQRLAGVCGLSGLSGVGA